MPDQTVQLEKSQENPDEISLIDLAITMAKHKKTILAIPAVTAILVAIVTMFIPNTYTASTKLLPPQQQSGVASALLGQLGALGAISGALPGLQNPNDMYISMLKSRTVSDNLIRRFKLKEIYRTKLPSETRKALLSASKITSGKDGLITVQVEDIDPKLAASLANSYVEELQKLTGVLAVTEASQRRLFFEQQLKQARQSLSDAEIALKQAQEKTGIIRLDIQAEALVKASAELKAQIAMKEVELGALRTFATTSNPDYIRVQRQIDALRRELSKVQAGTIPTGKIPEAGLDYMRKVRDVKYTENLFELLAKQFELAKIEEAKQGSVIQVLDRAIVPDTKSKPRRSLIVLLATVASGFIAIIWVFLKETIVSAEKNSDQQAQLEALQHHLRWK